MKIGIFTDVYYPQINGVVTSVITLRDELIRRGHDVTIITSKQPGHKQNEDGIIRIKSIPFSKFKEFRLAIPSYLSLYRKVRQLDLDVIHTHTEFSIGLIGRHLAHALDIPLVHTYHTMYEDYTHYLLDYKYAKNILKKTIIQASRSYIKPTTAVIAPSEKTKNALLSYGVNKQIFVLPTGIDMTKFKEIPKDNEAIIKLREKHKLDADTKVVLSLGRVSEEKSIDMIVKQMPSVLNAVPNSKLMIVGDGPHMDTLKSMAKDLGIEEQVIFVGRVPWDQVSNYYALADVFVSASKTETQGLTIIEAMASNRPVVVYDDDNVKGLVKHDYSGLLFTSNLGLSTSVVDVLTNEEKAQKLAEQGCIAAEQLSTDHFGQKAELIYEDLVQYKYLYQSNVI